MALLKPEVGQETLEGTPERLLRFLLAVTRYPHLARRLRRRGYSKTVHETGHALLNQLGKYKEFGRTQSDPEVKAALEALNELDEDVLLLISAALRYKLPLHHEFMLNGLEASRDPKVASQTLMTVLTRITALEDETLEKELVPEAATAFQALADKGLDAAWRQRVTELTDIVRTLPEEAPTEAEVREAEAARLKKLEEVRAFFEEWADTARVEFKGRRDLIHLGLAQLRSASSEEQGADTGSPSVSGFPGAAESAASSAAE